MTYPCVMCGLQRSPPTEGGDIHPLCGGCYEEYRSLSQLVEMVELAVIRALTDHDYWGGLDEELQVHQARQENVLDMSRSDSSLSSGAPAMGEGTDSTSPSPFVITVDCEALKERMAKVNEGVTRAGHTCTEADAAEWAFDSLLAGVKATRVGEVRIDRTTNIASALVVQKED